MSLHDSSEGVRVSPLYKVLLRKCAGAISIPPQLRRFAVVAASALLALGYVNEASAQNVIVQVTDSVGQPIPFALVDVNSVTGRVADTAGFVRVANVRGETLKVRARRIGYVPVETTLRRTSDNDAFRIVLKRVASEIESVYVRAERSTTVSRTGFYDRMERVRNGAIVAEFITPEELDQRKPMQISHILQGRRYVQVQREGSRSRAVMLGRGRCKMTILLDGVRMNGVIGPGEGRDPVGPLGISAPMNLSIDELVEGGSVAAVEIYPSTANAPAELIPLTGGGSCGIIALWTGGRR